MSDFAFDLAIDDARDFCTLTREEVTRARDEDTKWAQTRGVRA